MSAGSSSMVRTDQGGLFHKKMQGWLQQRFPRSHVTHFNAAQLGQGALARSSPCGHSPPQRPTRLHGADRRALAAWMPRRGCGGPGDDSAVLTMQAAMPAVPPDYMQHCVRLHVPADADLIFLEAAANMCGPTDKLGVDQCNEGRASVGQHVTYSAASLTQGYILET